MKASVFNNSPHHGCLGMPYSFTWDITPVANIQLIGTLPSGLTMSENTISGIPDTIGEYKLTAITVTEKPATQSFTIKIKPKVFRGCYLQE